MSAPSPDPILRLTPRQRRLRVMTVMVLVAIIGMIVVGFTHPLFRAPRATHRVQMLAPPGDARAGAPTALAPVQRRRLAVRGLVVLTYWSACMGLTLLLFIFAWLDVRETRKKALLARVNLWNELANDSKDRRGSGHEG